MSARQPSPEFTATPRYSLVTARRDRHRERMLLDAAEQSAGMSGFAGHARRRLEMGERCYADRWAHAGLRVLLDELAEEAADLGAWAALASQALDAEPLGPPDRDAVAASLLAAARAGALAHAAVAAARDRHQRERETA